MAVKFTNNAATTLAAGINSSVTSIAVTDGSVFPAITGGDYFYVTFDDSTNKEIVKVTARSGNTLTAVRGQDDTTARAFNSGDKAELRIVAALLEDVKTDVSSTLTVDTFTGDGSATAFTLSTAPASEDNLIVFIEGVYQNPGDFVLSSGTTLTFDVAPANSRKIIVYHVAALVSGNNLNNDQFTCNGSTTAFTLGLSPIHENNTQVFLDGVYQQKTDYAVSGTTLTMDAAPANGAILEVMTFTQTDVNTLPASFVSGLTQATAVGADHFMIFDATDSALKKSLVSDVLESATSISTSADATAITIDSSENVTFTAAVTTGTTLSIGGNNNELRFYEGANYVGFEAPALSADKIWVLPAADGTSGQVLSTDGSGTLSFATVSGTTISNNADNRIITGSNASNTLNGEADFIFDGQNAGIGLSTLDNTYSASHTLQLASISDNNWSGSLYLTSADGSTVASRIVASTDGLDLLNTKNTNMRFFTNNTERLRLKADGNIDAGSMNTTALRVPNGTEAQRPTGSNGMLRYNTTSSKLEGYIGSEWKSINAGIPSLTTISGLDLWMDVTGGISSTTIADLSGNSRTGTATSTTNKGTVGSNTYMLCNSGNYIEYANGKIPNYSADVTYFFVCTNVASLSGHQTFLGQLSDSTGYQIIRTASGTNNWQFYFTNHQNVNLTPTNTALNVNSTIGANTQILTFSFGSQANGNLTVYKRTGGTNTSDVFSNNTFPNGNSIHSWVANGQATRLGNSSWANEFFGGGIFSWGIIDHPITTTELGVIYDYYSDKGLGS